MEADDASHETQEGCVRTDNRGKRKEGSEASRSQIKPPKAKKNTTKASSTRSLVWKDYTRLEDDRDNCTCNHCHRQFGCASAKGTSNLRKHLLSCKPYLAWNQSQAPGAKSINNEGRLMNARVSEAVFRDATNELLVLAELPLSFCESLGWRQFCNRVNLYKPHSIVEMYVRKKAALKE